MAKEIEFFYDLGSPAAYLAHTQLPKLAERTGARVRYRPMLLGGVFKAVQNRSPIEVAPKGKWLLADLGRWARRYGVPFTLPPTFPLNTLPLMRGAVVAERDGRQVVYADSIYRAMFAEGRDLGDAKTVASVLAAAGFDPRAMFAAIEDESVKESLKANTAEAIERGVFGAPTFFVGGELHWGQDRLDFVEQAAA